MAGQEIGSPVIKTEHLVLNVHEFPHPRLLDECIDEIQDKLLPNPKIIVFGKEAYQRRSIGFFSDESIGYRYSGQLARSQPLSHCLKRILNCVNEMFDAHFNGVLVNKYGNGNDYIGAHSDDERDLDNVGVVAISYGAERKFRIRDKITKKRVVDVPLTSHQVIHMGGDFQKEFTHEIPVQTKVKTSRFSLTFRNHNK